MPRLKPTVEYCSFDDKIYFFARPGIALKFEDKNGFILRVCKLLNGKHLVEEIKVILSEVYPKESEFLEQLLKVLDNEFLLEDLNITSTTLTPDDLERWSRNIEFFGTYCKINENKISYQEKINTSKVAVFGLGGVGSNILLNLAALGVVNFKIVDFDNIQLSNLNRQVLYNHSDLGKSKSMIAKKRISAFNPTANIEIVNQKVESAEDIEKIITDQDIVISAIDQPRDKTLDWFNLACHKKKIPFITGGLDNRLAICFTIFPGKTGCIECWKSSKKNKALLFQDLLAHPNFVAAESQNVAIIPLIAMVSSLVSSEYLKLITGIGQPKSLGQICAFDFLTTEISITEKWEKIHSCSVCGTG